MAVEKFVYDFSDYRRYLEYRMDLPAAGRGSRTALAKAIASTVSHISQVLAGISHFSLEQAEAANHFLGHSEAESDFFLLLVQYTRAASPGLQKRLAAQIDRVLKARLVIKDRIDVKDSVSPEAQAEFYSSWHYQALHILATIPRYQTLSAMAERLALSQKKTAEILEFLVSIGLVKRIHNRYQTTVQRIHLGADSPLISKHHSNWRLQALQSLDREARSEDLHYSSVISVSEKDLLKIRDLTIDHINQVKKIVKDSPEEEAFCFSIDCFKI